MKTNKLVHQIQYRILSPQILNFNKTKNPLVIKKPIILEIFCMKFCAIQKIGHSFCMCKNVQSLPPGGDILCFSIHIPLRANEARLRYRGLNCYWYFFAAIFLIVTIV